MKNLAQFFQNKDGQFSADEFMKLGAFVLAVAIAVLFYFTRIVPEIAAPYVLPGVGILLGYALGQGISGNVTNQ
jgi:hypothetical protein